MEEEISFGHFLRTRRKALDLTQETLAQQVGCAVITIRKFESEARRPSQQMAARLASVLDLSDDERDAFIQLARQHAHNDFEEQGVDNSEEELSNLSEETKPASILSVTSEAANVPATASDIMLTIPKSRLLWATTIGLGALFILDLVVWYYGPINGTSPIPQLASTHSEYQEGKVFLPMMLSDLQLGSVVNQPLDQSEAYVDSTQSENLEQIGAYPEPTQPENYQQFGAYPVPATPDMPEQIEAYPGPVHPDALHEARATPGVLIETQILTGHEGYVRDVAFSPEGQFLASSGVDAFINIWRVEDGKLLGSLGPHGGSVDTLSFSFDGQLLASAGVDSTIKVWRLRDGHMLRNDPAHEGDWIRQVLFNSNNTLLASISSAEPANDVTSFSFERSTQVALWRVEDGTLLRWLETPPPKAEEPFSELQLHRSNTITYITFSPNGQLLAAGQMDGSIAIWRVVDGVLLHSLYTQDGPISSLVFSPDSQTLVSGSKMIHVWDVQSGDLLKSVSVDTPIVERIMFNADTTLFAALKDTTIYIGQTNDGSIITALEGHLWPISSVAFSPDNNTLASGSLDMTIRLWDLQSLLPE
ncbi:MAG: hypothetical protein GFH27_549285n73 [Chloroflexi bacterium AL-W]|nr:hypothetical protein [Chloroflexi bacterium AL-N1]NOK65585.1 hypothetical protein [Chloroflexi bacterium AL-N10]NOK74474.1 hypothetical protein [Chloroflexi bacterium AL-N5]NOK80618.1 hypothetical protein [Chloroflexi bacterium AL-W]NOK88732.1 hypothetical protein [Chloroflexi bacterium AL-N15]